jgi:hypothetical protein
MVVPDSRRSPICTVLLTFEKILRLMRSGMQLISCSVSSPCLKYLGKQRRVEQELTGLALA